MVKTIPLCGGVAWLPFQKIEINNVGHFNKTSLEGNNSKFSMHLYIVNLKVHQSFNQSCKQVLTASFKFKTPSTELINVKARLWLN